jgi:CheY-like chemotaxis protein
MAVQQKDYSPKSFRLIMTNLYTIFFSSGAFLFALVTDATWWMFAGVLTFMAFLAYRFYASRLYSTRLRMEALEQQVEQLHIQVDGSIRKEQRMTRAAEQAIAIKKRLMVAMSHEIRTPMNGMIGMACLLEETLQNNEQLEYTRGIRHCGQQLMSVVNRILVDDMLNISKSGENGGILADEDFDVQNCLEEVLDLFTGAGGEQGPDLLYRIDDKVPGQLRGDSDRLRQILINLVQNAVNATSRGEIYIGVRLLKQEGDKMDLAFEVRDTGTGIPASSLERIFDGSSLEPSQAEVTGLGLPICKRLVEMMAGSIDVQSEPGKGSVFTFSIKVGPGRRPLRNALHQGPMTLLDKHILVVDDNAVSLALLSAQLQEWKASTVCAVSGQQALSIMAGESRFDLVITDEVMPFMSGFQLAGSIRERNPVIPILLLTRNRDAQDINQDGLFSSVLTKPLKQHLLRDMLVHSFTAPDGSARDTGTPKEVLPADFSRRHPLRVLVAEDNPMNQKIAMRMLGKLGYEPRVVGNGKEVLEALTHERYDLLFMDVQMPEMDGLEATRMIRLCVESQPVIIAMTANVMQGDRDDCFQAGMDDYISKPMELDDLLAKLGKWSAAIEEKRKAPDPDQ